MISETILNNTLVHQKDGILSLVNKGEFEKATFLLESLLELWENCSYSYKFREIVKRMSDELWEAYNDSSLHWKHKEKARSLRESLRNKFPTYF
jgi:hypothetical protein